MTTTYEREYTIDELIKMNGFDPCGRDTKKEVECEEIDFFTGKPIK